MEIEPQDYGTELETLGDPGTDLDLSWLGDDYAADGLAEAYTGEDMGGAEFAPHDQEAAIVHALQGFLDANPILHDPANQQAFGNNLQAYADQLGDPSLINEPAIWRAVHLSTLAQHGDPSQPPDPEAIRAEMVQAIFRGGREPAPRVQRTAADQQAIDAIKHAGGRGASVLNFSEVPNVPRPVPGAMGAAVLGF